MFVGLWMVNPAFTEGDNMHTRILSRAFSVAATAVLALHSLIAPLNGATLNYADRARAAAQTKAEMDWEEKFRAIPRPDLLKEYMRALSADPHHVGSPADKHNAEWIRDKFKSWGL